MKYKVHCEHCLIAGEKKGRDEMMGINEQTIYWKQIKERIRSEAFDEAIKVVLNNDCSHEACVDQLIYDLDKLKEKRG